MGNIFALLVLQEAKAHARFVAFWAPISVGNASIVF